MPDQPAYSNPLVNIVKKFVPVLTVLAVMIVLACLIIPVYAVPNGKTGFSGGKMGGGMTNSSLYHLEEQGFDVTAIRTAVESGDMDTARSLMKQFMEEHKDELPAPPEMGKGCRDIPGTEENQTL